MIQKQLQDTFRTDTVKLDLHLGIKPVKPVAGFQPTFWEIALPLGVIICILALAGYFLSKRLRSKGKQPFQRSRSALQLAEAAITKLDEKINSEKDADLTEERSQILRRYLSERFSIPGNYKTRYQIIDQLKYMHIQDTLVSSAGYFLSRADALKFAGTAYSSNNQAIRFLSEENSKDNSVLLELLRKLDAEPLSPGPK